MLPFASDGVNRIFNRRLQGGKAVDRGFTLLFFQYIRIGQDHAGSAQGAVGAMAWFVI